MYTILYYIVLYNIVFRFQELVDLHDIHHDYLGREIEVLVRLRCSLDTHVLVDKRGCPQTRMPAAIVVIDVFVVVIIIISIVIIMVIDVIVVVVICYYYLDMRHVHDRQLTSNNRRRNVVI